MPVDAAPGGERLPADEDVLLDREIGEQNRLLVDDRDPGVAGVGRAVEEDLPAVHEDRAGVRRMDSGEDLDEGRLAGAVLAHESVYLAGEEVDRHVLERLHGAERLRRVL